MVKFLDDPTRTTDQIVLGNSTVIQASATSKSDLFFALKGGGPNYGKIFIAQCNR